MIFFIISLYILPLFLIKPNFISRTFARKNMVGIPLFFICYFFLIIYYIPLIINSTSDLGILEDVIKFVRYQPNIDYESFYNLIIICTSLSIVFFILGYLIPIKIKNIYFENHKNNLSKILLLFSIILFLIQIVSVINFGPNYFKGYLSQSNFETFPQALQLSIISVEIIGVINALNLSLKNPNKWSIFIFISSIILLGFRAKRLELLAAIIPTFLSIQRRNISQLKDKIKIIFPFLFAYFIMAFIAIIRSSTPNFNIINILFSVFSEPFLATQSFQGYLTINNGDPRFSFINTLAAILSVIPTIILPNKWEYIYSNGFYDNKEININGANIILTGLYDDFGIIGIILFSFLLGCIIRYADKSRILSKNISYFSNTLNLQTIIYYFMPIIILHFRDGYTNTLKYFIQLLLFVFLIVSLSSRFKLVINK